MDWGRRYLMCPPDYFSVSYSINPWMEPGAVVDRGRAADQWLALRSAIETAGGMVEIIEQHHDLPDMVFTANLGVVANGVFVPSRMRHRQRQAEPEQAAAWATQAGLEVRRTFEGTSEGMGDALPYRGGLIAGHGPRSQRTAWSAMTMATGWPITSIPLPDPRFYHIDLVFCPLDDRRALIAPLGLVANGMKTLTSIVPRPIMLTGDEALSFAANSIVVGSTVIMPACSPELRSRLATVGFAVVVVDVGEFEKAGGAVRCLTLPLDTTLPSTLEQTA